MTIETEAEPLDIPGFWWLPEHEDHRVFGTLRWTIEAGGQLRLQQPLQPVVWRNNVLPDGSIQKYPEGGSEVGQEYPVILGQADEREYTLLHAHSSRMEGFGDGVEHVRVDELIRGVWFQRRDDVQADRVFVTLRHLTGWVDPAGLSVTYPQFDDPTSESYAVVSAVQVPALQTGHGRCSVTLKQTLGLTGDCLHSLGVTQGCLLRLAYPEPQPLSLFLNTARDFQDLLSIAVGEPADVERVIIHHPDVPLLSMAGTRIGNARVDVEYRARWTPRSDPCPPVQRHKMYFTLNDLGGMEGVERWLGVAETYRTELSRAMATRYSPTMFLEDRIMNVCAALDSFDRTRRSTGRIDYVKHINECVVLAGQPFIDLIVEDPKDWAKMVKETRHDLAHHRYRFRREGTVGEHVTSEQLFWLFALCMLRLAQAPEALFESMVKHGQFEWLREQARNSLP